jgi:hypothetical protein
MYRETTQFHHLLDLKDQVRSLEASQVLSLPLEDFLVANDSNIRSTCSSSISIALKPQ